MKTAQPHDTLNKYWQRKRTFFKNIYSSKNISLETNNSADFFDSPDLRTLNYEEAEGCEGLLTMKECADALNKFQNNLTPGSDGLTVEFYRVFLGCDWTLYDR